MNDWNKLGFNAVQVHSCDMGPKGDSLGILQLDNEDCEPYWALVSVRVAGSKEVEDGEAKRSGEILSSTEIAIMFCPYCGVNLK